MDGRACAAQHITHIDDLRDAGTLAAEILRHHDPQQPVFSRRRKRLVWESRLAINRLGIGAGYTGDRIGTGDEVCGIGYGCVNSLELLLCHDLDFHYQTYRCDVVGSESSDSQSPQVVRDRGHWPGRKLLGH
jgi:hypothetical protein